MQLNNATPKQQLTDRQPIEGLLRPLAVSDFVRDALPAYLEGMRQNNIMPEELYAAIDGLLTRSVIGKEVLTLVQQSSFASQKLALLDLVMLECALEHSKISKPKQLVEAVDILAGALQVPPRLTYELIVRNNPPSDTRVFTNNEYARVERGFYIGHEMIERQLTHSVISINQILRTLADNNSQDILEIAAALATVTTAHEGILSHMRKGYGAIDIQAFDTFRQYLFGTRGHLVGPSGSQSANHPALRLLVFGPDIGRSGFIEEMKDLYPRCDTARLREAQCNSSAGIYLAKLAASSTCPFAIKKESLRLMNVIIEEQRAHLGVVLRAILKQQSADKPGTGGQAGVRAFLENGIQLLETIREKFVVEAALPGACI